MCPAGQLELETLSGDAVGTFADTSQIYSQIDDFPGCFDPATGLFTGTAKGSITGGTGRFTNATGSFQSSSIGFYLIFDDSPESLQDFGPFTASFTGDIYGVVPPGDFDFCSETYPCTVGQGDCDSDSECRPGLVCLNEDVGYAYGFNAYVDVCVRP